MKNNNSLPGKGMTSVFLPMKILADNNSIIIIYFVCILCSERLHSSDCCNDKNRENKQLME